MSRPSNEPHAPERRAASAFIARPIDSLRGLFAVSIRARLFLLVLSILLPALLAAGWALVATYRTERDASAANLRDTARAMSMVVERELGQRSAVARVLSLSRSLDNGAALSPQDRALFELQARGALEGLGGWVELSSEDGVVVNTRLPAGAAAGGGSDPPAQPAQPTGATKATKPNKATKPTSGAPLAESPAVLPLVDSEDGSPLHARVTMPVRREGRALMSLAVTVLPQDLQKVIDQQRLPPQWLATLMDDQHRVVARHPGGLAYAGKTATAQLQAALTAQREGLFESMTLDGVPVLLYFNTTSQGWTYLVGLPRSEFAMDLPRAVWRVGLATAALMALALLGALWVARRIAGPIDRLKALAGRLGRGEAVERQSTGITECDEVAAALAEASRDNRQARATLEQQVAMAVARTREAEQRVSRGQRVEALGRLTGGVAHDFNNLLGVISNSAYLIERHAGSNELLQPPLGAILRAVDVGSRLTQHLLRFAGRQPVSPQTVDLRELLPEVQYLLKAVLGSSIVLTIEADAATQPITVDASELELSLINLALNARDALPGGGRVAVRTRNAQPQEFAELAQGDWVVVSVSDTGAGIEPALLARVFEPFFTTKEVGKGTGLGLSQVHGFCTQAGGIVHITSQHGQTGGGTPGTPGTTGTTVHLVLPAGRTGAAPRPAQPAAPPVSVLSGRRVLLVDDNLELSDVTTDLLASYGCEVSRARSADEALQILASGKAAFDVVLSDVVMPGSMDGVALARTLQGSHPALPVVLITGYAKSLQGEAHGFTLLHKPCSPQDLVEALRAAIEGS